MALGYFAWWLPGALYAAGFLLGVSLRTVTEHYTRRRLAAEPLADRILRNLLTHGRDPRYRTSGYWSVTFHVLAVVVPLLIAYCGGWDVYGLPKGSGQQVATVVQVRVVKKKPKRKFVLNPDSPIIFDRPDIDDSTVREELEYEASDPYMAQSLKSGKLGKGGGTSGGWPHGMANAKVRFIRLKYRGGDWQQDLAKGADYNFLQELKRLTGFAVARNGEYIPIWRLRRFKKDHAPPFVFITGSGNVHFSSSEIRTLRWYCLREGGMIFADNGGGRFNHAFRRQMRRVFPRKAWVDIPNDDIIYRRPFRFPNGAPPLWHHSGYRALGLKHHGRWIVFYHQGDIADAWKTRHSGTTKTAVAAAYQLGVNIVNYAFNQYHRLHFE
jgi:hypothetical protein